MICSQVPWPEQTNSVGEFAQIFSIDFSFLNEMEVSFSITLVMMIVWLCGVHITANSHRAIARKAEKMSEFTEEEEEEGCDLLHCS